jgi:hypothetical protein
MAITATRPITELFDPNLVDASGGYNTLAQALLNDPEANRLITTNLNGGKPTFIFEGNASGSETTVIANTACSLAVLGVSFPANTLRAVYTRVFSRRTGATAAGYAERLHMFLGNAAIGSVTTPADAAAIANDVNLGMYVPADGTLAAASDIVTSHAGVDATVGPFLAVFNSTAAAFNTGSAQAMRFRLEVYVGSLITFPTF